MLIWEEININFDIKLAAKVFFAYSKITQAASERTHNGRCCTMSNPGQYAWLNEWALLKDSVIRG